jgi:hypothetical protein
MIGQEMKMARSETSPVHIIGAAQTDSNGYTESDYEVNESDDVQLESMQDFWNRQRIIE